MGNRSTGRDERDGGVRSRETTACACVVDAACDAACECYNKLIDRVCVCVCLCVEGGDHRTSHVRAKTRVSRICLAGSIKSASATAADCAASIGVRMIC